MVRVGFGFGLQGNKECGSKGAFGFGDGIELTKYGNCVSKMANLEFESRV